MKEYCIPVAKTVSEIGASLVGKNTGTKPEEVKIAGTAQWVKGKWVKNFETNCHNKGIKGYSNEGSQKSTVGTNLSLTRTLVE